MSASPASLKEILGETGLHFSELEDGAIGVLFTGARRTEGVVVRCRVLSGGLAAFGVSLPPFPGRKRKTTLKILLRATDAVAFTKAVLLGPDEAAYLSTLPMESLTPAVAGGVIRGLGALGDLGQGDLASRSRCWRAVMTCADAHAQYIGADAASAMLGQVSILPALEEEGIDFDIAPDGSSYVARLSGPDVQVLIRPTNLGVLTLAELEEAPKGDEAAYMMRLLSLNTDSIVAKVGLSEGGGVSLRYEVPRLTPELVRQMRDQFTSFASDVTAIDAELGG